MGQYWVNIVKCCYGRILTLCGLIKYAAMQENIKKKKHEIHMRKNILELNITKFMTATAMLFATAIK